MTPRCYGRWRVLDFRFRRLFRWQHRMYLCDRSNTNAFCRNCVAKMKKRRGPIPTHFFKHCADLRDLSPKQMSSHMTRKKTSQSEMDTEIPANLLGAVAQTDFLSVFTKVCSDKSGCTDAMNIWKTDLKDTKRNMDSVACLLADQSCHVSFPCVQNLQMNLAATRPEQHSQSTPRSQFRSRSLTISEPWSHQWWLTFKLGWTQAILLLLFITHKFTLTSRSTSLIAVANFTLPSVACKLFLRIQAEVTWNNFSTQPSIKRLNCFWWWGRKRMSHTQTSIKSRMEGLKVSKRLLWLLA